MFVFGEMKIVNGRVERQVDLSAAEPVAVISVGS